MDYNITEEDSEEVIVSYPNEGRIDEYTIPCKISEPSSQAEDSGLKKIIFD